MDDLTADRVERGHDEGAEPDVVASSDQSFDGVEDHPEGVPDDREDDVVSDIFLSMVRGELDVSELELAYFLRTFDLDDSPFLGQRIFPNRNFRHSALFVNADSGIDSPADQQYRSGAVKQDMALVTPWFSELFSKNRALLGEDRWPYGVDVDRRAVDTFLSYHFEQGLSRRLLTSEDIFAPRLLDT